MTASPQLALWRAHARRALAPSAAMLVLAACEIPTAVPQVDQRYIVPPQSTTIAVASLLPAGVRIVPDSSAFTLDLPAVSVTRALSADCSQCSAFNGTRVPKPAFVASASVNSSLPSDIASATLTTGSLQLSLQNNYNFDPLRPSATARGYAVITVSNGGTVIGRDSVDGATTALTAGGALIRTIPLSGVVTGTSPVTVALQLNSPAGDTIQMDAGRTIVVTGTPGNLRVASAAVAVVNRQISSSATTDLTNLDSSITAHVTGGSLLLDVANPFNVGGTIAVQFASPNVATVTKSIALASGTTHPSVTLDQTELRSLLGHAVTVSFAGAVTNTGGPVTVTPKQALVVTSRLDISLHTGG